MTKTRTGFLALLGIIVLASVTLAASGASLGATTQPTLHNFLPRLGTAGTVLHITGANYSGATAVTIGGVDASYTVVSATRITATVASGATTGAVSVTTRGGTATSRGNFGVVAPHGSGTLTTPTTTVLPGATGQTITFTDTAAIGGMVDGALSIVVPSGWSAPGTTAGVGCTSASTGAVSTIGQTIYVRGLTVPAAGTVTITYGATSGGLCTTGDTAKAATTVGSATWSAQERSIYSQKLTSLTISPSIIT
jgi:hypothetical protein